MTPEFLAAAGHRILAVTSRVPQRQVDNLAAEVGIMLSELCHSETEADELTAELVKYPQARWNFAALRNQAELIVARWKSRGVPAESPPPAPPLLWYGRPVPEWAHGKRWAEFEQQVDAEAWQAFLSLPTARQRQLEADVRRILNEHQAQHGGPFNPITQEHLKHYLIVQVLCMQERGAMEIPKANLKRP